MIMSDQHPEECNCQICDLVSRFSEKIICKSQYLPLARSAFFKVIKNKSLTEIDKISKELDEIDNPKTLKYEEL